MVIGTVVVAGGAVVVVVGFTVVVVGFTVEVVRGLTVVVVDGRQGCMTAGWWWWKRRSWCRGVGHTGRCATT